ncbi:MAG: hypothetical protein FWE90_04120 [Defluviitaleaceae bacterium]|nr:hypothetical protein [Defluviitaleaceae bacterium]
MRIRTFKRNTVQTLLSAVAPILLTLAVVLAVTFGMRQADESSRSEGARFLEESILRAAVHSYATSGQYPENLAYIIQNYGIHIDRTRYAVHYTIIASNILPDITVITLNR